MANYRLNDLNEDDELRRANVMAVRNNVNKLTNGALTGIGVIDKSIESMSRKLLKGIKRHFGLELTIYPSGIHPKVVESIYEWMNKYNNNVNKLIKKSTYQTIDNHPMLTNTSFMLHFDRHTYAIVNIGDDYRDRISKDGELKILLDNKRINDDDIYMYIFGKHAYTYYNQVNDILSSKGNDVFRMYNVHGDPNCHSDVAFKSLYQDIPKRKMSTIFMEPGCIEKITSHIDNYLSNRDMYSGRGIIYKTGILLYGEPGTGKTSLIKTIASMYNYELILIDMATFDSIGLETFTHSINIDDKKYIIALEDIDCVIADRENENADKDDKKVINKLLQFLDSNSSPNDVIFIASTNHIELLDEALMREGRFDLKVEICGVKEAKAREMCKSFDLSEDTINTIINDIKESGIDLKNDTIRQSRLQSMILKYSGMNLHSEEDDIE